MSHAETVGTGGVVLKTCPGCGQRKSLALFHSRTNKSGTRKPTARCAACRNEKRKRYRSSPEGRRHETERGNEYRRRLTAQAKLFPKVEGLDLDLLRRALVERPDELSSEEEAVAYYRGFLAGHARMGGESARFDRLKDLVHRIVSEATRDAIGKFIGYEALISHAYEGLLDFIRNRQVVIENQDHERKLAAQSIRWAVKTAKRSEGPYRRSAGRNKGVVRYAFPESWLRTPRENVEQMPMPTESVPAREDHEAASADLWSEVRRRLSELEGGERLAKILWMRAQGLPLRQAGEELGISESRVCQIVVDATPWLERHILPLLKAEPALADWVVPVGEAGPLAVA
jgi:hypothetical protein